MGKVWKCMYANCGWVGPEPFYRRYPEDKYPPHAVCPRCKFDAFELDEDDIMVVEWDYHKKPRDVCHISLDFHTAEELGAFINLDEEDLEYLKEHSPKAYALWLFLQRIWEDAFRMVEKEDAGAR
jgi:hypothetical protein